MEFSAVNRRRPSSEMPLGPGAKKDGSFRRLNNGAINENLYFDGQSNQVVFFFHHDIF